MDNSKCYVRKRGRLLSFPVWIINSASCFSVLGLFAFLFSTPSLRQRHSSHHRPVLLRLHLQARGPPQHPALRQGRGGEILPGGDNWWLAVRRRGELQCHPQHAHGGPSGLGVLHSQNHNHPGCRRQWVGVWLMSSVMFSAVCSQSGQVYPTEPWKSIDLWLLEKCFSLQFQDFFFILFMSSRKGVPLFEFLCGKEFISFYLNCV